MAEITRLLVAASRGDQNSFGELFDRLYPELRRLAVARCDAGEKTLTPTVLVHEAYLRLLGSLPLDTRERAQFFACAARAMRCIAVDAARRRKAQKRGGATPDVTFTARLVPQQDTDTELLALDEAMGRLQHRQPRQARVVELHYFAGFGFAEVGELLGISECTAKRDWARARAYLHVQLVC